MQAVAWKFEMSERNVGLPMPHRIDRKRDSIGFRWQEPDGAIAFRRDAMCPAALWQDLEGMAWGITATSGKMQTQNVNGDRSASIRSASAWYL